MSELIMATPMIDGHRRGRRGPLDQGPLLREQRTSIIGSLMAAFDPIRKSPPFYAGGSRRRHNNNRSVIGSDNLATNSVGPCAHLSDPNASATQHGHSPPSTEH